MVTITKTAATSVSFRARTTTGISLGIEGTTAPVVRQNVRMERDGWALPVGFGVCGYDATRVETTGLASVKATPLGHRAWSPPL
jgi:hypothetical protein